MKNSNVVWFAIILVVFLLLFVFFLNYFFTADTEEAEGIPINPSMTFYLTEEQIKEFSRKAEEGDADSAFKLHQYFAFLTDDRKKSMYWLEISAKNGNVIAQYSMAYQLDYDNEFEKALHWAEIAKSNGFNDPDGVIDIDKFIMRIKSRLNK
jgi:hypothetical protein